MRSISAAESPWVYILSQFTPEAIYLEILVISILLGCYALYWLLRRRRIGLGAEVLPATLVKSHLNELIADSEALRAHLFGLMGKEGVPVGKIPTPTQLTGTSNINELANSSFNADPALLQKIMGLESKIGDQTKEIERLLLEKTKIEEQLVLLKGQSGNNTAGATGGDNNELLEKIKSLEARLAEYSVIEDDLANLKRLQQENQQLKGMLGDKAPSSVAPGVAIAAPVAAVAATTVADAAIATPATTSEATPEAVATTTNTAPAAESIPASAATPVAAPATSEFEGLVDKVEQSLTPTESKPATSPSETKAPVAAAEAVTPTVPAKSEVAPDNTAAKVPPTAATSIPPENAAASATNSASEATPTAEASTGSKSDQDLLSEFEKLLGG